MLKHSVKLRRYLLCGCVAHNRIINNDVISPNVVT